LSLRNKTNRLEEEHSKKTFVTMVEKNLANLHRHNGILFMNNQQTYIALETIVTKEIRRFTRIWVQTLLPPSHYHVLIFCYFWQYCR
jgi:hypothetical protein